jgi:hypothetical protein
MILACVKRPLGFKYSVLYSTVLVQQHRQSPESLFRRAVSLNNLSQRPFEVDHLEEGLQTNQEAVDIY